MLTLTLGVHLELSSDLPGEKPRADEHGKKMCSNSFRWVATGMGANLKKAKGYSEERFHTLPRKTLAMPLGLGEVQK